MPEQDLVTEETLRALMAHADVPASPLTVTGLVSGGRRRVRRRRLGTAVAIAVLAILVGVLAAVPAGVGRRAVPAGVPGTAVSATASAQTTASRTCPISDVAMPAGTTDAELVDISPNGRYYVGHTSVGQNFRPVIWVDGVPQKVAFPASADSADLLVVNSAGVAAGEVDYRQYGYVVRYQDGVLHQLRYPPGGPWYLIPGFFQLNEAGDLRAEVEPMGSEGNGANFTTLIWPAGQDTPRLVKEPAGVQIVGFSTDGSLIGNNYTDHHAYIYDAQARNGRPLPVRDGWYSNAMQVRGDWVVGGTVDSSLPPKSGMDLDKELAVAWNVRTGETVTLHGAAGGDVVNSAGALASEGQMLALDHGQRYELTPPGSGYRVFVTGMSDDGTVIGYAWTWKENPQIQRALRWKC